MKTTIVTILYVLIITAIIYTIPTYGYNALIVGLSLAFALICASITYFNNIAYKELFLKMDDTLNRLVNINNSLAGEKSDEQVKDLSLIQLTNNNSINIKNIYSYLETLNNSITNLNPSLKEMVSASNSATENIEKLINNSSKDFVKLHSLFKATCDNLVGEFKTSLSDINKVVEVAKDNNIKFQEQIIQYSEFCENNASTFKTIYNNLEESINKIIDNNNALQKMILSQLSEHIGELDKNNNEVVNAATKQINEMISNSKESIEKANEAFKEIRESRERQEQKMLEVLKAIPSEVKGCVDRMSDRLEQNLDKLSNDGQKALDDFKEKSNEIADSLLENLSEKFDDSLYEYSNKVSDGLDNTRKKVERIIEPICEGIEELKTNISVFSNDLKEQHKATYELVKTVNDSNEALSESEKDFIEKLYKEYK